MRHYRRLILVCLAALLIPILPFVIIGELPGERWLSGADDHALRFGLFGSGLLAADILLPVPSSIVGTLLGARLGFTAGSLWTWAGLMLGNLIGYGIGRLLPGGHPPELPQTPTLLVVLLSRPVPVLAEAVMLVAGAEHMRLRPVLMVCILGNAIYALTLAGNGALLLPNGLLGPGLLLPMVLPVVAWLLWRWLRRAK
jgi:membrane protein YqaA with SNARE-associated domain